LLKNGISRWMTQAHKRLDAAKLVESCGYFAGKRCSDPAARYKNLPKDDSLNATVAHPGRPEYHGYDVARLWMREPGLSIRRLIRDAGVVPIPRSLPGYRVALSLAQNQASLAIGKRVTTTGRFAPGVSVLGQPGDMFDGEMRDRVDVLLFLMEPAYVAAQLESRGLPSERAELRDLPPRPDIGLFQSGTLLADALSRGLAGDELYCEILIDAMVTRIVTRHATLTSGRTPYRESLSPAKLRALVDFIEGNLASPLRLPDLAAAAALSQAHLARAFRNAIGISLHRYVLQRRLRLARDLLSASNDSVQSVATQCGFANDAHLSKAYKRVFGMTPAATRGAN
jgi:AraC family transcriptional regulator